MLLNDTSLYFRSCHTVPGPEPRAPGDTAQDLVLPWDTQKLGGHRTARSLLPLDPELCRSRPDPRVLRPLRTGSCGSYCGS